MLGKNKATDSKVEAIGEITASFIDVIASLTLKSNALKQINTNIIKADISLISVLTCSAEDYDKELSVFINQVFNLVSDKDAMHILSIAIGKSCANEDEVDLLISQFTLPSIFINVGGLSKPHSTCISRVKADGRLLIIRALELLYVRV